MHKLVAMALLSGCATIMSGGPDHIPISTNPPGASVFVDGTFVGQTPMIVTMDPKINVGMIHIEAQGFLPINIQRYKSIDGWFWANICWAFFPMIVDLATGEYQAFDDTPIALGMTPAGYYPQPQPQQPPPAYPPPQPPPGYPQPTPPPGYPTAPPGTQPPPLAPPTHGEPVACARSSSSR
jgi:hypothetical protein